MMRVQYCEYMPEVKEPNTFYYSPTFQIAIHLCPCGCGNQVVTSVNRNKPDKSWQLSIIDNQPTLTPSVWCKGLPCKSHYYLTNGEIQWV